MGQFDSGYWDFYEDEAGYWHWRFASPELPRIIASQKAHASSDECVTDALEHGYTPMSARRVTRNSRAC